MKLKFMPGKDIPRDTPLWRYMSVGAFFLLVQQNKVFVPTLRQLQEAAPKEMRVPLHSDRFIHQLRSLAAFREAREWLKTKLRARTGSSLHPDTDRNEQYVEDLSLIDEWIYQLSIRRYTSCWFSPSKPPSNWVESMAMWSLYARNGVAIKTTLEHIIKAFQEHDLTEVLVAEVEYSIQRGPKRLLDDPEYAKRPFLFKSASYGYESEVRLVFKANDGVPAPGIKVNVDAKALLEGGEVIISPFLVPDEQNALVEIAKGLLPKGTTVTFRASSELAPGPDDPTHSLDSNDEIDRLSEPFCQEPDLPELLREL
jgi:hypothetical protein